MLEASLDLATPDLAVLLDVAAERTSQDRRWGPQDHAHFHPVLAEPHIAADDVAALYGMPTADVARDACEVAFAGGEGSWAHILVEEIAEALAEHRDPHALRAELLQVAAVAVAWVGSLDRQLASA